MAGSLAGFSAGFSAGLPASANLRIPIRRFDVQVTLWNRRSFRITERTSG
jgi:hypothetical protein